MGLDIYFNSRKNNEEVAYFRKHNHLLPYFNYDNGCSEIPINKAQMEDFIDDASIVLEHYGQPEFEKVAEERMPTQTGFFFGCYEYDDYYKGKLEEDIATFKEVLETFDWDNDTLMMYCSW